MKYSGVTKEKTVLVIGTGPTGIATVACLKAFRVPKEEIMIVGRSKEKNERVRQLGVEHISF